MQPASSSGQDLEDDLAKSLGVGKVSKVKGTEKEEGKWEKRKQGDTEFNPKLHGEAVVEIQGRAGKRRELA